VVGSRSARLQTSRKLAITVEINLSHQEPIVAWRRMFLRDEENRIYIARTGRAGIVQNGMAQSRWCARTRAAASTRQHAFHGFCLGMTVLQWFLRLAAGRFAAMQCLPAQRCPASAR
jgi:hypothetical protein